MRALAKCVALGVLVGPSAALATQPVANYAQTVTSHWQAVMNLDGDKLVSTLAPDVKVNLFDGSGTLHSDIGGGVSKAGPRVATAYEKVQKGVGKFERGFCRDFSKPQAGLCIWASRDPRSLQTVWTRTLYSFAPDGRIISITFDLHADDFSKYASDLLATVEHPVNK